MDIQTGHSCERNGFCKPCRYDQNMSSTNLKKNLYLQKKCNQYLGSSLTENSLDNNVYDFKIASRGITPHICGTQRS